MERTSIIKKNGTGKIILLVSISLIFLGCTNESGDLQSADSKNTIHSEKTFDSTALYSFFKGKETLHFNEKGKEDSLIITYNQYGLPEVVQEYYLATDELNPGELFGTRIYSYNIVDSIEKISHLSRYGAEVLLETRKFDSLGRILFYQSITMDYEVFEQRFKYDETGKQIFLTDSND
ncbi:MAG: hypothetical protein IPM77_16550 [Crocinitomicaceae bacterium]|nr:hypothetical protein [Crocinitomicaceae bacterium]